MHKNLIKSYSEFKYSDILYNISGLNREYLIKNDLIPIKSLEDTNFFLSLDDNFNIISNIEYMTKKKCILIPTDKDKFQLFKKEFINLSIKDQGKQNTINIFSADINEDSSNLKVINYLNNLIGEAINTGVSDIHIEPFKDLIRIRYRINGQLEIKDNIDTSLLSIILTRTKILANMDISERRLPQDGRITFQHNNRDIDLRISTLPTIYGEKIAIRILDSHFKFSSLESLGIEGENLQIIKDAIKKLSGLILISGPTNSGKSSTIFSILNNINSENINITTLEDPVEYKINGINQIQVNYKTGLEFVNTLNYILRQDPDVLAIGEI